jgi:hypothetical protein
MYWFKSRKAVQPTSVQENKYIPPIQPKPIQPQLVQPQPVQPQLVQPQPIGSDGSNITISSTLDWRIDRTVQHFNYMCKMLGMFASIILLGCDLELVINGARYLSHRWFPTIPADQSDQLAMQLIDGQHYFLKTLCFRLSFIIMCAVVLHTMIGFFALNHIEPKYRSFIWFPAIHLYWLIGWDTFENMANMTNVNVDPIYQKQILIVCLVDGMLGLLFMYVVYELVKWNIEQSGEQIEDYLYMKKKIRSIATWIVDMAICWSIIRMADQFQINTNTNIFSIYRTLYLMGVRLFVWVVEHLDKLFRF